ncbi:RSF2-like protein [Saccharomyces kudriavzevii IFO 1802]|uniref:RSF2-like protein n=1 Tax=Saccharomyces kudriavzevii (strain ATCC MYA-4449 / AS 2.2408 / CBS 8840 / NBRC 1802 / NCYC 2889) TaxID=226230 RepID=J6ECI1_SACK1|nr:RSF2-like protein [Saccharomyces kudriavzevii IFO 1802]
MACFGLYSGLGQGARAVCIHSAAARISVDDFVPCCWHFSVCLSFSGLTLHILERKTKN